MTSVAQHRHRLAASSSPYRDVAIWLNGCPCLSGRPPAPPPPPSDQILANESRQIAALGAIEHVDYIFEDRAILAQGFKDVRMTYEALSKIDSPEMLQKVVYGTRPDVAFVVHST